MVVWLVITATFFFKFHFCSLYKQITFCRYILESSYNFHINRKSVKISYKCRHCGKMKLFYNRCNFLAHIRFHSFKTATINVTDLKVEPLPIIFFNMKALQKSKEAAKQQPSDIQDKQKLTKVICMECKEDITMGTAVDRVKHYMEVTDVNTVHSCPVCLFALPTECALKTHLRVHLKCAPYICPECGTHLSNKSLSYPYHNHDCEGFKMMRATTRIKCQVPECHLIHPNEYKDHMKNNHLNKVFKCPYCYVGCLDPTLMQRHMIRHVTTEKTLAPRKPSLFYQCGMCKGRLVMQSQIDSHLKGHMDTVNMYPCWACGKIFKDVPALIEHHIKLHGANEVLKNVYDSLWKNRHSTKAKRLYRVVKRCEKCKRSFRYKCKYDQIKKLPSLCPYQCTKSDDDPTEASTNAQIICHFCKQKIPQDWELIKKHYAAHHPTYRCLDANVTLSRLDDKTIKKYTTKVVKHISKKVPTRKPINVQLRNKKNADDDQKSVLRAPEKEKGEYNCSKCGEDFENKELFERHLILHIDPCMAYQCMECGQCFVVKPTFSKHLILEHGVSDVEEYILNKKQCFNESALLKYQYASADSEPLKENQCKICRDQFDNASDLEKHFRVHGMAFLMKTKSNSP